MMAGTASLRTARRAVELCCIGFAVCLAVIASYPTLVQVSFWIAIEGPAFPGKPQVWITVASTTASSAMLAGMVELARARRAPATSAVRFWRASSTLALGLQIGGILFMASALATNAGDPHLGSPDWWLSLGTMLASGAIAVAFGHGIRLIARRVAR
jgi:hypothetical protein